MKLNEYLLEWKQLIYHNQKVDLGLSDKVATLYRDFVQNHYLDILPKVYSRLDECWTCPWEQWRDGYFQQYPPYAWELNHLAQYFPAYLKEHQLVDEALVDLARYEWAEHSVFTRWPPKVMASQGDYVLNPAHELLELRFDVAEWIFHWEREHAEAPLEGTPLPRPNVLIISRDLKTLSCVMTRCDVLTLVVYQVLCMNPQGGEELFMSCQKDIKDQFLFTREQFQEKIDFLEQQSILYKE